MDLRRLEYFVVLAEELHFGRAAERLHVAQPGLSQQIKVLEGEVGARLFDRDHRAVALSDAGRVLLPDARAVLAAADRAAETMRRWRDGHAGVLRVGVPAALPHGLLPQGLARLSAQAPELEVETHSLSTADQVARLERGELDVGIVRQPPADGLNGTELLREPMGVALPSSHPLTVRERVRPRELSEETLIWLPRAMMPDQYDQVVTALSAAGFTARAVRESPDTETSLGLVAAGLGFSVKLETQVDRYGGEDAGVAWRPLDGVTLDAGTWAVWPAGSTSSAVRLLLDALTSHSALSPTNDQRVH